jgi:hypothetical protein
MDSHLNVKGKSLPASPNELSFCRAVMRRVDHDLRSAEAHYNRVAEE